MPSKGKYLLQSQPGRYYVNIKLFLILIPAFDETNSLYQHTILCKVLKCFKRIKYLFGASMGQNRLTALALIHINLDVEH